MKNSKPYNYSAKDRNKKTSDNKNSNKSKTNTGKKKTSLLDNTIRIDPVRLNDSESLDTSFLEARVEKKVKKNKKLKERILVDNTELLKKLTLIRKIFIGIALCVVVVLAGVFVVDNADKFLKLSVPKKEEVSKQNDKKNDGVAISNNTSDIDNNYLFVGDFHSGNFDFVEFELDYHYVKSCREDLTIGDILNNMKEMVYTYNPSIVFIQVGYNDIEAGESDEDIINNLTKVVKGIQNNRPNALIYVESLYPVNEDSYTFSHINTDRIIKVNKQYKKLCDDLDVNYLDVYSALAEDKVISSSYSSDGLHLNSDGYEQVLNLVDKVVG